MKIEKLTEAQIAKFPTYVREWTGHGTCTAPADRPRAEAAIRLMYEQAGLAAPQIVWCDSPLSMILTRHVWASVRASVRASVGDSVWDSVWDSVRASVGDSVWASVWDSVWASVGDSVRDSVRASVWASVWDSVRASVWASVGDSVRDSVRASVWASVGDSVRDSVWASVGDSVRDSVWASVGDSVWASVGDSVRDSVWASAYGQHDASWLAFYRYFRDECGLLDQTAKLAGLWELCQSCGWILSYEGICFASERHDICSLDERGRIHSETGPAIHYPDGFAIYAWHGVRVPAEWIEGRNTLDPAEVLKVEDVEQRAAGCEIVGFARMAEALGRKVIDGDPDTDIGALVEMSLPGLREPGRFLEAVCPRNGRITLGVPHVSDIDGLPITTAIAAQAYLDGVAASEYQHPTLRT